VRDSHRWPGSSAAAGPRLLGGGTGLEATVVGEVGRWHRGPVVGRLGGWAADEDRWAGSR
jgi:hypothetical protein